MHLSHMHMDRRVVLGLLLSVHVVFGNVTSICRQSDRSLSYLDIAVDMITKAKTNYPVCPPAALNSTIVRPVDCEEVLRTGQGGAKKSGIYTVWPRNRVTGDRPLDVYCDMDTDGGGWLLLQRRGNFNRPNDYFYKDWVSYKNGFGDIDQDFWLGNDNIFALTNQRLYSIRFDLKSVGGEKGYALYDSFWIDGETRADPEFIVRGGNPGDSMIAQHNNAKFSTRDQDNDNHESNCADTYKGGWWYNACHHSNLNGLYLSGKHESFADGIEWLSWKGYNESLNTTEMKIRPKGFRRQSSAEYETPVR